MGLSDIRRLHKNNLAHLWRSPLSEISGALGDLGTLLPLMIALSVQHSTSLPSTLVFTGIFNILTGVVFGVPLPVQPMKAIAAAAIASHASQAQTLAAGALVAIAVGLLSITGLIRWLTVHIPIPVVKGIQFGAGLQLVISGGGAMISQLHWVHNPFDNKLWAIGAFLLLLLTARFPKRFPYALIVFAVGLLLAFVAIATHHAGKDGPSLPGFRIWHPSTSVPGFREPEAWAMAVAQLPLTTLNSVIAAAALASELMGPTFPGNTPTVTELGVSVALMNLVGCWFGAMPVCHGAGGLAAQHRFGARSGASIILLGAAKLLLGLFFGTTLLDLLGSFPRAVLGIMVIAAGLELAKVGQSLNHGASDLWEDSVASDGEGRGLLERAGDGHGLLGRVADKRHRDVGDDERLERWTVMLMTAAGILAFKNDAVGFAAGMLTFWGNAATKLIQKKYGGGEREPLLQFPDHENLRH